MILVDVQKELDLCVKRIGGVTLDSLHGADDETIADYWFQSYNVVAELKCLTQSYFDNSSYHEWLNSAYARWVKAGLAKPLFARTKVNLADLHPACNAEVTSYLRSKLDRTFNKANSQIKNTKVTLDSENALGLLILVNDGNNALPPGMIRNIVVRSLPAKFSCINSIIHFTANMPCDLAQVDKDLLFWCVWNAAKRKKPVPASLVERIREEWLFRHAQILGVELPILRGTTSDLYNLTFLNR